MSSLTYINPTATSGLIHTLTSALAVVSTAKANAPLYTNSGYIRGASNSLNIISAQAVLATATDAETEASATAVIEAAIADLEAFRFSENIYSEWLTLWPNATYAAIFGVLWGLHTILMVWSKHFYFGGVFFCGCGLTFAGYLGRSISVGRELEANPFLVQIICLTMSPAFIMAGIYYILGRMLTIHGDSFCILKPKWFSYIFVSCDVISLVVQAVGGGMAATAVTEKNSTDAGTNVMVGGIAFQVASMSLFYLVMLEFVFKIYFRSSPQVKFSIKNLFALFMNTRHGDGLRQYLEPYYEPIYHPLRSRRLFPYIPFALYTSTLFIYIRCIYRLVELSEGWSGYLITHQAFLMSLDALQVCFTCTLMVFFHPYFLWGPRKEVKHLDQQLEKANDSKRNNSNSEEKDLPTQDESHSCGNIYTLGSSGSADLFVVEKDRREQPSAV